MKFNLSLRIEDVIIFFTYKVLGLDHDFKMRELIRRQVGGICKLNTRTVRTKEELKRAKEDGVNEIVALGKLALDLHKAKKLK